MPPYVLALWDGCEVELNLGHGQDIGGCGHVHQEVCTTRSSAVRSIVSSPLSSPSKEIPIDAQWMARRTLDGVLCTHSGDGAHATDHEVLEELGGFLATRVPVLGKAGDLGGLAGVHVLKRALEGGGCGIVSLLEGNAGWGAQGGQLLAGAAAGESPGRGSEVSHDGRARMRGSGDVEGR
jgi:hypothetical protein